MQTINLKQYYPFCTEDTFVEVSDEIVEAFLLDKRAEAARERKMYRYKAHYSLDCDDGIEKAAIGWAQPSPEDYIVQKEEQAEHAELLRRLYEAISSLPPTQARRVHARYMLGMKVKDIAVMEGITPSQAGKSIHAALRRLRRYFVRRKWTGGLPVTVQLNIRLPLALLQPEPADAPTGPEPEAHACQGCGNCGGCGKCQHEEKQA